MVGEVVESTPQVVEHISTNGGNLIGNALHADEIIAALAGVKIVLALNYIWVGIEEGVTRSLQILNVLSGPLDFYE